MYKHLLSILFCTLISITLWADSWWNYEPLSTDGTDFWATFMANSGVKSADASLKISLLVVSHENKDIQVSIKNPQTTWPGIVEVIQPNQTKIIPIPTAATAYNEQSEQVDCCGLHITSTGTISLYATNSGNSSLDATLISPSKILGNRYIVQTYSKDRDATEFVIVATSNNTRVTITPADTTVNSNNTTTYSHVSGESFSINLNKGQTYQVRSYRNTNCLSGTQICSNYRVAVFNGNQAAYIPQKSTDDHLFEQSIPILYWGKHFLLTKTLQQDINRFRITASENNTQIKINGIYVTTLNAYETYEGELTATTNSCCVESDKPSICFLYMVSSKFVGGDGNSDPSMVLIPPTEQFIKNVTYGTFVPTSSNAMSYYVNIVCATKDIGNIYNDATRIPTESFSSVDGTNNAYSYIRCPIKDGAHSIHGALFSAYVYGLNDELESYAYSAGFNNLPTEYYTLINGNRVNEYSQCIGKGAITFQAQGYSIDEGNYNSITWNWGDGTTYSKQTQAIPLSHTYTSAGTYTVQMIIAYDGCETSSSLYPTYDYDTIKTKIKIFEAYTTNFTQKACQGETIIVKGRDSDGNNKTLTFTTDTRQDEHFFTADGCDSIVHIDIRFGTPSTKTDTISACSSYVWHGKKYTQSGKYKYTYTNEYGCPSVDSLILTINMPVTGPIEQKTICKNSVLTWNGIEIKKAGTYTATLTAANKCDSLCKIIVAVEDEYKDEQTIRHCPGEPYHWRGKIITEAKTYEETALSPNGCDSIFILHYQHYPTYDKEITFTICSNQTYMFGDTMLTTSGTYVKRFQTIHGCDSIVTLHLVVNNAVDTIIYDTICRPELATYRFGNIRITDSGTYYYYGKTIQGCDSVVTLHLIVNDPSEHHVDILTCESQLPYHYGTHGKTAFASGEYRDTLDILNKKGCDSVLVVHLTVVQTIRAVNNVQICDIDTPYNHREERLKKLQGLTKTGEYSDTIQTIQGCDSIVTVNLQVFPSYQKPVECTSREICDNDTCHFYGQIIYGDKSPLKPMRVVGYAARETYYTLRDTISTIHGCDSVVEHHLMVYPTYFATKDTMVCQDRINKDWKWIDDVGDYHGTYPIDKPGEFVYGDTLLSIYGCDSILGIRLIVNPTYYYYDTATICQNETYFWQDSLCLGDKAPLPADQYYRLPKSHGVYDYVINYTTEGFGCDSAYYLHLTILPAYIEPIEITQREICDNDTCHFLGQIIYGDKNPLKPMSVEGYAARETYYTLRDTISTIHGCDSVVEHHLMVYPTYFATKDTMVCQDRINKDWKWIDDVGDYHGTYPIDKPGEFVYGDTLSSIHGCDSILGIRLIVNPTYYYYDTATICQNETYFWQDSLCLGDKAPLPADQYYRLPKSHGVYDYAINYTTKGIGCDSAYYLHLVIRPAYPTVVDTTRINICDNEMYSFHDASIDTIYNMHGEWKMEDKSIRQYKLLGMDTTLLGCDSAVAHIVTVYPTYLFVDTIKVCLNDTIMWREKKYMRTGVYFDSLQTIYGCDSVYMLNLFVKPVTIIPVDTFTCANEELRHVDTIWYSPSMYTEVNTMVWTPGMPTPQKYTDVIFKAMDGCDSIIYRYYLKINPTYFSKDTPNLCSNDVYVGSNKQTYSFYNEYDVDQLRPYLDTLIIDSLKTQFGCDSVYQLQARIYPAYRHVDYDTICFNEHCYWRERKVSYNTNLLLGFDGFGDFVFRDSFLTTTYPEHACDSIYELRLHVNPSYDYNYPETTICIDELPYIDGQILINRNQIKPNIDSTMWYCDSILEYKTILGCDSIIHLQLLVLDTTAEVIYDTICVDSVYTLYGKTYTQTGFYKDTTINDWGCHNFVYLYLTVIQPTKYWLNIPDICADEDEIEIGYSYEGQPIVEFSVLFDSLGHAQGFEDIDHQPISDYEQQRIYIPIPHKEALPRPNPTYFDSRVGVNDSVYETKFAYPEPNDYHVRVILGNGYCPDDKQTKDTVWKIYYPSWIHEQHWNDGIVLYNEIYNGNYTFSHYQWYWNDEPIIGQVREFLYWPDSLHLNQRGEIPCVNEYKVELTRESDGYTTFTCPICPVQIYDHIVPKMDYFSIVPTLVVKENPVVWILTTKPLSYQVWDCASGKLLMSKTHVIPDANNYAGAIKFPVSGEGVICVELRTDDGESRTFKILVK